MQESATSSPSQESESKQRMLIPELAKPKRQRLGTGPRLLLALLKRLPSWRTLGYADPSHAWLAEELGGVSTRTIQTWVAKLKSDGLLTVEETSGRRNRYYPPAENPTPDPRRNLPGTPEEIFRGPTKNYSGVATQYMTQRDSSSDTSAAAVETKAKEKTEETIKEFSALGADPQELRPHVEKDPAQAGIALAILRARSRSKPPNNPTGFALIAIKKRWSGPAPPPRLDHSARIERQQRERAEQERQWREQMDRDPPKSLSERSPN